MPYNVPSGDTAMSNKNRAPVARGFDASPVAGSTSYRLLGTVKEKPLEPAAISAAEAGAMAARNQPSASEMEMQKRLMATLLNERPAAIAPSAHRRQDT